MKQLCLVILLLLAASPALAQTRMIIGGTHAWLGFATWLTHWT